MWSRSRCALAPAPLAKRAVARRARYGQLRNACQGTWRSFCRSVLVAFYLARKVTYAESFRVAITDRALDVRDPLLDWLDARPPQCTGDAPRRARQGNRPERLRAMPWPQHGDERWLFARGMAAHLRHDGGSTQATGRSRCRLSRDALSGETETTSGADCWARERFVQGVGCSNKGVAATRSPCDAGRRAVVYGPVREQARTRGHQNGGDQGVSTDDAGLRTTRARG